MKMKNKIKISTLTTISKFDENNNESTKQEEEQQEP